MRSHSALAVFVGAVFAVAFLVHCGVSPAGADDADGGAATDGGTVTDGGSAACDCPAAPKPVVLQHACDSVREESIPGDSHVIRYWYAEIPVDGLLASSPPLVSVVACNRQCLGFGCPDDCPSGYTCTGYDPDAAPCASAAYTVEDGKIVVACGTAHGTETGASPTYQGYQYQRAVVTLYPSN